jgi:PTS system nitrogen regulatory IIA component
MAHDWMNLDELAKHLNRDRRAIEKLVKRGRIPAHKVANEWRFNSTEITHWLESELREYSDQELANVEETNPSEEVGAGTPVASLLRPELVEIPLQARTKRSVLEALIEVAGRTWQVWEPAAVLQAVQDREEVLSTGFDNGVAIPHPRNPLPDAIGESLVAYGRTFSGIPFGAPKRALTDVFFLVLCQDSRTHLQVLARLARMLQQPEFVDTLRATDDARESFRLICDADQQLG